MLTIQDPWFIASLFDCVNCLIPMVFSKSPEIDWVIRERVTLELTVWL